MAACSPVSEDQDIQNEEYLAKIHLAQQGVSSNHAWVPFIREIQGFEMVLVPTGCFLMGSEERADEMPIHAVCLTSPFWFAMTEISNATALLQAVKFLNQQTS